MYQLVGNPYYVVANRTNDTFTLTYPSGVAVDTTNFGTYTGGGTIKISYRVANATTNTFELQTAEGGTINASGWTAYVSGGTITTTIPDGVELFRSAWTASASTETNVATEALIRIGRSYGAGLTVNLTKSGVSVLAIQGSGGATTVGGTLGVTGSATAASLIVTGSTVPVNGMYLSSGNTVALAANTTQILTGTSTVIAVKPTTASTSSTTGALTVAGGLGVVGTVYAGSSLRSDGAVFAYYGTDNQVHFGSSSIEIGLTGRVGTSTPFIDFHSSASSPDYDARIVVSGGSATSGSAAMTITSSTLVLVGPSGSNGGLLTINTASNGTSGTAVANGIVIVDSANGSGWDTGNLWAKLEFNSLDVSTGGPGGRVRIGPVAESTLGGASRFSIFQAATANTFLEKWALTSAGRMLVGGVADDGVHMIQALGSIALNLNAATAPGNLSGTVFRATQADSANAYLLVDTFAGQGYLTFRKSLGTNAAPVGLGTGSILGSISGRGYDGSAYSGEQVRIALRTDEAWSGTAHGTAIVFSTTTLGTTTLVDRVVIDAAGITTFGASGNTITIAPNTSSSTAATITGAGTGGINFATAGGIQFQITNTASSVNYASLTGGATGSGVTISALGSDTNINLILNAKGSGVVAITPAVTGSAAFTATAFIPSSSTVPTNGMYLPAANTLGWAVNSAAEMQLTLSALSPAVSDGTALGTTSLMWADAFLASGAVINFNAGNYTLTHSAGLLTASGPVQVSGTAAGATIYSMRLINASLTASTAVAISLDPGNNGVNTRDALIRATNNGSNQITLDFLTSNAAPPVSALSISPNGVVTIGSSGNTVSITPNTTSGTAIAIAGGGTGGMTFAASGGVQLAVTNTASAVNYVAITGGATGNGVTVSALGANADVNLILDAKGTGIISALDHINLASGKVLQINGTQVVGAHDTGWAAMTGTTNKATVYDTATVTLAQLAGRVMALQAAATTHGLIGA